MSPPIPEHLVRAAEVLQRRLQRVHDTCIGKPLTQDTIDEVRASVYDAIRDFYTSGGYVADEEDDNAPIFNVNEVDVVVDVEHAGINVHITRKIGVLKQ